MNFVFGTLAGGMIACVITIVAARQPEIQARLGLIPPAQAALAAPPTVRADPLCAAQAKSETAPTTAAQADMLFAPRRFWFVAPR